MDKENVIKEFEEICGYTLRPHEFRVLNNVLALLKEQEAVKPIYNEEKYGDHLPHCGNCEKVLPNRAVYGKVNFCQYCGRPVKQK